MSKFKLSGKGEEISKQGRDQSGPKRKSPPGVGRNLFLSLTKQNYLKNVVFVLLTFEAGTSIDCAGFRFAASRSILFFVWNMPARVGASTSETIDISLI